MPLTANHRSQTPFPCLPGFEKVSRYWDRSLDTVAAKILPGEFYVTAQDEVIVTVLGSCVSACIRDCVFGVGGMNHFMLPLQGPDGGSWETKGVGLATRYGNHAMEHLVNEILKNGGMRKNLEIKVFGGGKILSQMTDIGEKNIQFVLDYIQTEGLVLLNQDLGDIYPRKVQYHPKSGKVRIKKLRSLHNDTIGAREREYMREISRSKQEGEIDLF